MAEEKLSGLRQEIDELDQKILTLISRRAQCAQEVAQVKQKACEASGEPAVFYRPEREAQVLRSIMKRNEGPLNDEEMARLFREIMSACLALEAPVKVAYLGPEGTFTQQATIKHFGHSAVCVPMSAIDEVFREVSAGAVNYGVVPVENSSEGVVNHTLDSFLDSPLQICGEGRAQDSSAYAGIRKHRAKTVLVVFIPMLSRLLSCRQVAGCSLANG